MAKKDEGSKKQLLLRLSSSLWNEINSWAADDFRSVNSQIEYILSQAVKKRKNHAIKPEEVFSENDEIFDNNPAVE